MQPVSSSRVVAGATPGELFAIVTDFASYPRLFSDVKSTRTVSVEGNRHRVEFRLEMVVPIRYVLDLLTDPEKATVDWTYVEGEVVTGSEGGWRFVAVPEGTRMEYRASLTIKAPLPGFIVRRVTDALVSASLPAMFDAIVREHQARKGGG